MGRGKSGVGDAVGESDGNGMGKHSMEWHGGGSKQHIRVREPESEEVKQT